MTYETFKSGPRKGQPKTLTDRVIRYLTEGIKMVEVSSRNRYRHFILAGNDYWVGRNGAIRRGRAISKSISVTDLYHGRMIEWEKEREKENA